MRKSGEAGCHAVLSDHTRLRPDDLDLELPSEFSTGTTLNEARDAIAKNLIAQTLSKTNGNIPDAAVILGVSRPPRHDLPSRPNMKKSLSHLHNLHRALLDQERYDALILT